MTLRITDRANGPSQAEVGTLGDYDLSFGVPCAPTADMLVGATCSMSTTADSLVPGIVTEGKRAIWGMGQVRVNDGGADGAASTMGDNTPFAVQGIFVP